jgi:hypothetical protein
MYNPPNWGLNKIDMGNFPLRGDNPTPVAIDGRFYVPKYLEQLETTLYLIVLGEDNLAFLINTVFNSQGGLRPYVIQLGNYTYNYQGEVKNVRFTLDASSRMSRLIVDIVVPTPS